MSSTPFTNTPATFPDRRAAGRQLVPQLTGYADAHPVVVGVAPGGVPIAAEIARALGAPLEAVALEPLTLGPGRSDRFGVAAEGGIALFDPDHRTQLDDNPEAVDAVLLDTEEHLRGHVAFWHKGVSQQPLRRRTVLLVTELLLDERMAAAAACAVRDRGAAHIVYVAPKARLSTVRSVEDWVDEVVGLELTEEEISLAACFEDTTPVSDDTIRALLRENRDQQRHAAQQRAR